MYSKQIHYGLAIITIAVAAHANAGQANPLHPSFYWASAPQMQAVTSAAKSYADSRNPLHPAYGRVASDSNWQPAVSAMGLTYRDSNNPLHPSFVR